MIWQVCILCSVHKCSYHLSRYNVTTVSLTVFLTLRLLVLPLLHSITRSQYLPLPPLPCCPSPSLLPSDIFQFVLRGYRSNSAFVCLFIWFGFYFFRSIPLISLGISGHFHLKFVNFMLFQRTQFWLCWVLLLYIFSILLTSDTVNIISSLLFILYIVCFSLVLKLNFWLNCQPFFFYEMNLQTINFPHKVLICGIFIIAQL